MRHLVSTILAGVAALAVQSPLVSAEWIVRNPRVEYMACPAVGIDVRAPRFAWMIEGSKAYADGVRGVEQESFRVTVTATDSDALVWDSGRVFSDENRHVTYGEWGSKATAALKSATVYDWAVTVWLRQGDKLVANVTSEPARFVTSFLNGEDDWQGSQWMTGATREQSLCRRVFSVDKAKAPKRALLMVAGLGYFHATLNGEAVSDAVLESGWTDTNKRVLYSTYDVTHLLTTAAPNVLGVSLGNGWYATKGGGEPEPTVPRVFRAKLLVDGQAAVTTTRVSAKEDGWACHVGPIVYDSIYNGEVYDARLEATVAGWDKSAFDGAAWDRAVVVKGPSGKLVSPKMPPARRVKLMKPVSISTPQPGVHVFDFGQNFAGRVELIIPTDQVKRGDNVTLRHAEVLQHSGIVPSPQRGMIYTDNLRSARATDTYIFGGHALHPSGTSVVFEPTFTYHGFRYVEVTGIQPTIGSLTAWVIHSDVAHTGSLKFSDPLLQGIQSAIHWGQRCNILSVPTDCPQRDERKGWLGDAQLSGEESQYNFDMVATHIKFLHDIVDEQNEKGEVTDTAPLTFGSQPADPSWGSAFPSLVYFLWRETGDTRIVSDFYDALSLYVNSLLTAASFTGVGNMFYHYGDWCWVPNTPKCSNHLTAAFSVLENLNQMTDLATALGKDTDAAIWASYAHTLKTAFHQSFYVNGTYDVGVQTCLALPLWIQSPPDDATTASLSTALLHDLMDTQDFHFTTGIIGLKYTLEVLSLLGREDVGVATLQQKTYPSFGFMLTNELEPATTVWELWDAHVQGPGMNSRNHIMFGGPVGGFFYKFLGGIQALPQPSAAGYREFVLTPPLNPCLALESTSTSFLSNRGPIQHNWKQIKGGVQVHVEVPVGSTAHVVLDGKALANNVQATIDGKDPQHVKGVKVTPLPNGVMLSLVSGSWTVQASYSRQGDCRSPAAFTNAPPAEPTISS